MTVDRGVDTPPPTGTDDDIAPRIRAAVDAGELRGVTTGPVERLGTGESYTAWRVGSGEQARVLRLPRRPPHDLPRSMQAEFEVLRRVPPELGTSAVALETGSDNPLGTPYMVTTHVPGRALRTADWNPRFATALAHQIARLHEALATATATAPSDAVAPNVILGPDGLPRLIDFEWSGPGDTAKDLALIGGRVTGGPWYLPMTPDDVTAFVTEYSRYSRRSRLAQDTGAADPQRLLERRDAYELLDRLGNLLYCLSRPGEARYGRWADELARSLTARLGG